MKNEEIRWIQRFNNFSKALKQLTKFIEKENLNELEEQGLIHSFENTQELAWKTLKDFLEDRGNKEIYGSKDATRVAFKFGLISDGEIWMGMIKSRSDAIYAYNEEVAKKIVPVIRDRYYNAFSGLQNRLEIFKTKECNQLKNT